MLTNILKKVFRMNRECKENCISYEDVKNMMKNKNCILIDVRSPQEFKERHLENSINIPLYELQKKTEKMIYDKEKTIIVYCQTGNRSNRALKILAKNGYKNIYNLKGGLDNI